MDLHRFLQVSRDLVLVRKFLLEFIGSKAFIILPKDIRSIDNFKLQHCRNVFALNSPVKCI